jgi:hypothetical protein
MVAGTIRSQRECVDEENIAGKNSYAIGENSSEDGKHISDFMGKTAGDFILGLSCCSADMSHGAGALQPRGQTRCQARQFHEENASQVLPDLVPIDLRVTDNVRGTIT